jgi:NNP family nitrate/nitrite transporter-like MFS transporter
MKSVQSSEHSIKAEVEPHSLLSQLGPLIFLTGIFFLNFISRIVLSPLLPTVEKDLKIGHEEAGSFFFIISFGYCIALLGSSFVSSHLTHRRTIILSTITVGGTLLFVGLSHDLWSVRLGFLILGMTAGLYLPSGMATLTELVNPRDWGKAISIHELAPNMGFVVAPLIVEMLIRWFSWQGIFTGFGILSILTGIFFLLFGRGGNFSSEVLDASTLRVIFKEPSFWIMMALFGLGIGSSFGMYSMFPLYLVSEKGMDRAWANTLVGLSRIAPVGAGILSGWMTDRWGPRQALKAIFLANGTVSLLMSVASGWWVVLLIFLQPMLASAFFPPGFAALSQVGSSKFKNIAISLTMPVSFLIGGGAIPAMLGAIGEVKSFSTGFIILGGILLVGVLLARSLKFTKDSWQTTVGS